MHISDEMIHPELRSAGIAIRKILPYFTNRTFDTINTISKPLAYKPSLSMKVEKLTIPRTESNGLSDPLRVCIYRPKEKPFSKMPGVLWIHGGGYAIGLPEQEELFIKTFVNKFHCTVISPDYCLSTEAPYPAALKDCYTALVWMKEHANSLNINTNQLFVAGESAGGGLTAALSIYARDKGEVAIAYQMPLFPMLDDRLTPSSTDNDAPVWNSKSNLAGWKLYLGDLYGTDDIPAWAAPARLEDFSSLPPAATYVGDIEPFHDETVQYMENLRAAGIDAHYKVYEGCFHGFSIFKNAAPAKDAQQFMEDSIAYAIDHYCAPQK